MARSSNCSTAKCQDQLQTVGDLNLGWDAAAKADLFATAEQARKDAARNQARLHAVEDAQASLATGKPIDTSDATGDDMEVRTNSDNITNNYYVQSFDPVTTPPAPVPQPRPNPRPTPKPAGPLTWCLCIGVLAVVLLMVWLAIHPPAPTPSPTPNPPPIGSGQWKPNIRVE